MELNQLLAVVALVSTFLLESPVNGVLIYHLNPAIEMMHRYGIQRCKAYELGGIGLLRHVVPFNHISRGLTIRNGEINFEFYVITTGDAHIRFTSSADLDAKRRQDYVVVLGCCGRTESQIRRYDFDSWHYTALDMKKFVPKSNFGYKVRIAITSDGKITVFVDDKQTLSGKDTRPPLKNLAYLGFSAWPGHGSTFFFNCTTIYD